MSVTQNDKNPMAFPVVTSISVYETGMSLRDYFAAKAMQGLISSFNSEFVLNDEETSERAYSYADAMIKQR